MSPFHSLKTHKRSSHWQTSLQTCHFQSKQNLQKSKLKDSEMLLKNAESSRSHQPTGTREEKSKFPESSTRL